MKCEMPGCEHNSIKTISNTGIYFGIVENCEIKICENHDLQSIETQLKKKGERQTENCVLVNPFLVCKSLNRSCV